MGSQLFSCHLDLTFSALRWEKFTLCFVNGQVPELASPRPGKRSFMGTAHELHINFVLQNKKIQCRIPLCKNLPTLAIGLTLSPIPHLQLTQRTGCLLSFACFSTQALQ